MKTLLFTLLLFPVVLFSQTLDETFSTENKNPYKIQKCVDEMTDKVYFFGNETLKAIDKDGGKKGFVVRVSFKEEKGRAVYNGLSVKSVGIGNCVEESKLVVLFEDGSKETLTAWNDFNCKGNSYFDLRRNMISKLNKPINKIMFQEGRSFERYTEEVSTEDKSFFMNVVKALNQTDYEVVSCD